MWKLLGNKEFIDLRETLFSGQVFHFKEVREGLFIGNVHGDLAILKQAKDRIYFLEHNATIQGHLSRFFNLSVVVELPVRKRGLRFLTNEITSTIFSFICSSNNNIKRISKMVQCLYSRGDELKIGPGLPSSAQLIPHSGSAERLEDILSENKVHSFPTLDKLAGIENELRQEKFGYRASFISSAARFLMENRVEWETLPCEEARAMLMRMKGVGRKVADCICLVGLRFFHVVPLDTHLIRHSRMEFNLGHGSVSDSVYSQIQQLWVAKYGRFAGVVQLYVFKSSVEAQLARKGPGSRHKLVK